MAGAVVTIQQGDRACTWRRFCAGQVVAQVERTSDVGFPFRDEVCADHLRAAESRGYRIVDTYTRAPSCARPGARLRPRSATGDLRPRHVLVDARLAGQA